jgi:hypothetical protein
MHTLNLIISNLTIYSNTYYRKAGSNYWFLGESCAGGQISWFSNSSMKKRKLYNLCLKRQRVMIQSPDCKIEKETLEVGRRRLLRWLSQSSFLKERKREYN